MPFTVGQYLTANDLKSQEDAHTLGYGVVNGLKVVPTDPASMIVQVETGKAYVADTLVEKGAVTDLTVSGADPTNPRKDIVVCNSAGTLSIVAGTPEAALPAANVGVYTLNPEPPSIPANSIILAEIWVPAGATEITGSEIYDKRVFTVDRLDMGRMPDMALDKVMVGQGAGNSPVEEDKPAGDMAKAVYDPDADGKIALAQLVDAVCSETEAVAKVTFENLDAKSDVGTGAAQVAAGDHTHTITETLLTSGEWWGVAWTTICTGSVPAAAKKVIMVSGGGDRTHSGYQRGYYNAVERYAVNGLAKVGKWAGDGIGSAATAYCEGKGVSSYDAAFGAAIYYVT